MNPDEDPRQKILNYIREMPSLPTTVSKVLEICDNPQTSPADLNHVISLDPVLMGRVLKLINSAYYGLEQQVPSLVRAIIMLGLNTVKNLALSSAILASLPAKGGRIQGLNMEAFWRHSLCVGVAAKLLAKRRGIALELQEEYFAAGLLHDIGKIPLNAVLSQEYLYTVGFADRRRISLFQAEAETLGITHCGAGELVADSWKIAGAVQDTMAHHHTYRDYQGPHQDVLFTVAAANRFASIMDIGFSCDRFPEKIDAQVWETLHVNKDALEDLEPEIHQEIEKAAIFLRI
jgi:HD-like signal output (HDOD) protein